MKLNRLSRDSNSSTKIQADFDTTAPAPAIVDLSYF
jgi:hypothetical protein